MIHAVESFVWILLVPYAVINSSKLLWYSSRSPKAPFSLQIVLSNSEKEFIETAAGIEDALAKINAQPVVKNLPGSALLVQLKYAGSSTDEPLLTEIFKDYGVSSNILYGNLEILGDTPVGELVVVLDGEADKVLAAQKAIENAGVSLQVLKKGAQ